MMALSMEALKRCRMLLREDKRNWDKAVARAPKKATDYRVSVCQQAEDVAGMLAELDAEIKQREGEGNG